MAIDTFVLKDSTMTLAEVVLPLRLTNPQQDLKSMLVKWVQNNKEYNVQDCLEDLQHVADARRHIAEQISSKLSHQEALSIRNKLHYYYHYLLECERHRIGLEDSPQRTLTLEWESAMMVELQVGHTIPWERTNLLWNLATVEAYQAYHQPKDQVGWEEASKYLQHGASWLHHLSSTANSSKPFPFLDFYPSLVRLWKGLLLAESQRCSFEALLCTPQPNHKLVGQVATSAASMYSSLQSIMQQGKHAKTSPIFNQPLIKEWGSLTTSLVWYMKCMAALHLSMDARERMEYGEELALLEVAQREASSCSQASQDSENLSLQELHATVSSMMTDINARIDLVKSQTMQKGYGNYADGKDLPRIEDRVIAKVLPPEEILEPYPGKPLFANLKPFKAAATVSLKESPPNSLVTQQQLLEKYVKLFRTDMDELIIPLKSLSEELQGSARRALVSSRLPHSVTAYQQEIKGGGIPEDLWIRISELQRECRLEQVKRDLWELRDMSEVARSTFQEAKSQLDLDLENDESFRNKNPSFLGRDTPEIQTSYRRQLENYNRLLSAAQDGDSVLQQRVIRIEADPKFKLLEFRKMQLNKLLPGIVTNSPFDVTALKNSLLALSHHFGERNSLLETLEHDINVFDIENELRSKIGDTKTTEEKMSSLLRHCETPFQTRAADAKSHFGKQEELVKLILAENDKFGKARQAQEGSSSDACVSMLEAALEEVDEVATYLQEGKRFYSFIVPRLEKLRNRVDELSTKLTVERLEYNDSETRDRQEEADALMAKRLSQDVPPVAAAATNGVARGQPGWVDDEKVATLVAMDFDPDKVVEALKNQNNDVDAALNQLLASS
eukprot:scaffold8150_cov118-Cylindrotheca_fusiformis.AAC.13